MSSGVQQAAHPTWWFVVMYRNECCARHARTCSLPEHHYARISTYLRIHRTDMLLTDIHAVLISHMVPGKQGSTVLASNPDSCLISRCLQEQHHICIKHEHKKHKRMRWPRVLVNVSYRTTSAMLVGHTLNIASLVPKPPRQLMTPTAPSSCLLHDGTSNTSACAAYD